MVLISVVQDLLHINLNGKLRITFPMNSLHMIHILLDFEQTVKLLVATEQRFLGSFFAVDLQIRTSE